MNDVAVQKYELMVIFFPDIGEAAIGKELEELKKYISSNEGEVLQEDSWGARDLSYHIKKQEQGFYYVMNFTLASAKVAEMQRGLVINPSVIRALIVKTPEKYVFRNFAEYQEEEEKAKAAKEEAKQKKELKKPRVEAIKHASAPATAQAPRPPVKAEVVEAPKKVKKAIPAKVNLEEVDARLKSIIDDPDITL